MLHDERITRLRSFDSETWQFRPGEQAPPLVCASTAKFVDGQIVGELLPKSIVLLTFRQQLEAGYTIAFCNAPYDLAVLAQIDPSLLPAIWKAILGGDIHDNLIAQSLDQIYRGTLFENPETGGDLRNPVTGKVTNRYSLEIVHHMLTGRADAKANDVWRKSYALLDGIDPSRWPEQARKYPIADAENTLEDAAIQIIGKAPPHEWMNIPGIPGVCPEQTICKHCKGELTMSWPVGDNGCEAQPRDAHKNLNDLPNQVDAAFAAYLGACHGLRTDPAKVEPLAEKTEKRYREFVEQFQKKGWIRGVEDGETEDTSAVKKAIALAYGVDPASTCPRCDGTGKVRSVKWIECRGEKVRGRYKEGCPGASCAVCSGSARIPKLGNEVTCRYDLDDNGNIVEPGCDGTGLVLETAPNIPRSDKTHGVKTDRDTLMESGDDDLSAYGDDVFLKSLTNYIPYLRTGIYAPLTYSPNVLVASGRYSYEGSPLHQMPRKGGERGCVRARGAWCGSPVEYVLASTDYEAGELVALSQYCYWVLGHSQMRDAINASGKPGILHSDFAAQVLGLPLDEFLVRLKAKDKQAVDFRQAAKPYMFGRPGLMGSAKIVLTNRKSSVGFTVAEQGPAVDDKGRRGYQGIRFCILIGGQQQCGLEKITQWKRRECPPVCKRCVESVENILGKAYNKRYPEIPEYFNWVFKCLDQYDGRVPCMVWDPEAGRPRITRWRGGLLKDKAAACNNAFQAMLADMIKHAYVRMTRECYLGFTDEGQPSPLAGSRVPLVIHDEPLSELILDHAHLAGPRIAEIMTASSRAIAPDVIGRAETALAMYWDKNMEPVYVNGTLVPWKPPVETKKAA